MTIPEIQAETRVAVRAAYPSVRAGLRAMLAAQPGIALVDDGPEAEVTIVDLPEDAATDDWPAGPSVLLAANPSDYLRAQPDGAARAYLLKEATAPELAAAVAAVANGLVVMDPSVAAGLPAAAARSAGGPPTTDLTLSEREIEVLQHIAAGLPNKGIAHQLGISEHTVKFHVGTILAKLDAASRTEAVAIAVRHGLLPL
jgi:DNA-binding NarL/FixJ family response regulator